MPISNYNRSWILFGPLIPSVLCSIFVLYHFLKTRALRKALNNHVLILLVFCGLIEEITDLSWQIHFYRTGYALVYSSAFCYSWVLIGPSLYIATFTIMAWGSIERHILVFYPRWFGTRTKRLFLHYLPLGISALWPLMFYLFAAIILPCSYANSYTRRYCGRYSCVSVNAVATWVDSIANYILPAFVTVAFSVGLFVRVLWHRYRIRGRIDWRNYKKMALQLLPISTLYLLIQFPPIILYAAYAAGVPYSFGSGYYADGLFFTYWIVLFNPFACALSLPDLKTKVRNVIFFWRRQNAVQPAMALTRRNADQTVVPARKPGPGAPMKPALAPPPASVPAPEPVAGQVTNGEDVASGANVPNVSNQMPQVNL
ncbi:hypothetical protein I4U23_025188 [Adineta vaga]|nr:hypothetical protein I4U23_025188 [Adineta vaga]